MSGTSDLGGVSWLPYGDKVAHMGLYMVLGAALAWGRHASGSRTPDAWLVVTGFLYGVSDEWHQSFVPGRDPSVADLAADALGVLLGYATASSLLRRRRRGAHGPTGRPPLRR